MKKNQTVKIKLDFTIPRVELCSVYSILYEKNVPARICLKLRKAGYSRFFPSHMDMLKFICRCDHISSLELLLLNIECDDLYKETDVYNPNKCCICNIAYLSVYLYNHKKYKNNKFPSNEQLERFLDDFLSL